MHGYTEKEDLIGKSAFTLIAQEEHEKAAAAMQDVLVRGSNQNIEYTLIRQDGSSFPAVLSSSVVYDSLGKPNYFIAFVKDITERKRAEEVIAASLREKEVLLNEIHHRVKNNLNIITALINMQSSGIEDERSRYLFKVTQQRIRSIALVHDHLYINLEKGNINCLDYVNQLVSGVTRAFSASNCQVRVDVVIIEHVIPMIRW